MGPLQVSGRVLRVSGIATPAPWDYNLDGKMDLFVGARTPPDKLSKPGEVPVPEISPGCAYFENTKAGTAQWPLFAKGVPVSMCLASEGSGPQHKDADFLQPYATYPARWRNAARPTFLTLTAYGTFAFENIAAPGAYAHLHLQSGNGVPPPLLPELYSCVPVELRVGEVGLLAADAAYGFLCYYPRSLFSE